MDSLIKIDGKPIEKLIDVISNTIGVLYEPRKIIRKAKAESKAASIIAVEQEKTKALIDGDIKKAQYLETISERLVKKETRRQKNIEDVVSVAGNILETEETVSNEPVNSDWATRFFDIAQDISDDEMQKLWGQILAGEIKQPKSYSLRTLEILRNMTRDEAESFKKVAQLTLSMIDDAYIYSDNNVYEYFGITYYEIARLADIGLIQLGDSQYINYPSDNKHDNKLFFVYGDIFILISQKSNSKGISLKVMRLTKVGQELVKLIDIIPDINYIKYLAARIKNKDIKVCYTKIIYQDEKGINYDINNMIEL